MTTVTNIPADITNLKANQLNKNNNLSDLANRADAWLNVRPIGSTPLSADPVDDYDAATKGWVNNKFNSGIANTSWSVINGDETRSSGGTTVSSGTVSVEYKIGTAIEAQGKVYTSATIGGTYSTQLSVKNVTAGKEKDISLTDDGLLWSDRFAARYGTLMSWVETGSKSGTFSILRQALGTNYGFNSLFSGSQSVNTGYATTTHHGMIHNNNESFAQATWLVSGDDNATYQTKMQIQPNVENVFFSVSVPGSDSFFTLQKNAISDENLKHDIQPGTVEKAWSNLSSLKYVTFIYNNDEKERVRRGVIAQQAEIIDPLYVKTVKFYPSEGVEVEQKQLDTTPMLLDTMHVVQTLITKIESLEKENKQMKEIILNLNTTQTTDLP